MTVNTERTPWLSRFAGLTAVATFLLIIAGALVTSHEAGLAVPDWPLSYGQLMPPMVGGVFYEHGHRMVATLVGLLTTILAIWLWRREPRRWVRRLGWAALGVVIAQGILGGITVLLRLPLPVSVAHACLAQGFFLIMVSLALVTSPGWETRRLRASDTARPPLLYLAMATTAIIFLQLVLGAALRHSGSGIWAHLAGAAVVAAFGVWTTGRILTRHSGERRPLWLGTIFAVLLAAQILLGLGSYIMRFQTMDAAFGTTSILLRTAHVAVGALLLATMFALALESARTLMLPEKAEGLPASSLEAGA